ncbi:MAG: YbjN domain-containing protein [Acidobacteriota bacterium]
MAALIDTIASYFEKDGWSFRRLGKHPALEMGVAGDHGNYRVVVVAEEERSIVRFLTFIEGKIPEPRRRDTMEYLTRANYGLLLGNFELDLEDGEVRFRCSVDTENQEFSYAQYQGMLYTSVAVLDRYTPGLQRVIQGSADPAAAIAEVEQ